MGQAFELAYQMALRDQVTSKSKGSRDTHKSAVSPGTGPSNSRELSDPSRSVDIKVNINPLRMKPLTLSIATGSGSETSLQKTPTKVLLSDVNG